MRVKSDHIFDVIKEIDCFGKINLCTSNWLEKGRILDVNVCAKVYGYTYYC